MYKTSIPFIKAQIPNITIEQLLKFYAEELEGQQASEIQLANDYVSFSNEAFKFILKSYFINQYRNKFDSFSSGRICIENTKSKFWVTLQADRLRTLLAPAIPAIAAFISLFITTGFDPFSLLIGLTIYIVLFLVSYVSLTIFIHHLFYFCKK